MQINGLLCSDGRHNIVCTFASCGSVAPALGEYGDLRSAHDLSPFSKKCARYDNAVLYRRDFCFFFFFFFFFFLNGFMLFSQILNLLFIAWMDNEITSI